MELFLVKQLNNTFKVSHSSDYEKLKKIKVNQEYKCKITRPRNIGFHRKFFALVKMVFDNQERFKYSEDLREELIIEAGFFRYKENLKGERTKKAISISFAKMKEDEFEDLYSKVLDVIVEYFHFDKQLIIDNAERYF